MELPSEFHKKYITKHCYYAHSIAELKYEQGQSFPLQ